MNFTTVGFNPNMHLKLNAGVDDDGTEESQISFAVSETHTVNETAKLFFTFNDNARVSSNCHYRSCELMAKGCEWPYTATPHLKMNSEYPFNIQAATNVVDGYNTTFCVKCMNQWDSVSQDDVVFTQEPKTNWVVIVIIIAVVALVLVSAIMGYASYTKGKAAGAIQASEMTAQQTRQDDAKVPAEKADINDFAANEMDVNKPNNADNGD